MSGRHVDTAMLEGIAVECLDTAKIDWKRMRRTAPLNILLPSTTLWAKALPRQVRPMALLATFPRIANLLAASWKEPVAFHNYMGSLLFDHRGGRRGFPPRIKKELVKLRSAYHLDSSERGSDLIAKARSARD